MSLRQNWLGAAALILMIVASSLGVVNAVAHFAHAAPQSASPAIHTANTPRPAITHLSALAVQGARIVDATGKDVTLIGATRSSLEYLCQGDGHFTVADFQAMRGWGMNVVRITLSSEFWANAGGICPTYRQTVADAVTNAEAAGLYVILVLHWSAPFDTALDRQHGGAQCAMPDTGKDVAFWDDLAVRYHADPNVLFDLYGEPQGIAWQVWRNGGTVTAPCYAIYANHGSAQETGTYAAIGMQPLSQRVRAIAPNVIIISGVDWGYNLSGVQEGYAITTRNVVYATHPFDYATKSPAHWDHDFGQLAVTHAVIATEFGSYDCGTAYIAAAMRYFTARHMSWLAWSWNIAPCSGPGLLADWNGTPTPIYGAYVQQQIIAATRR